MPAAVLNVYLVRHAESEANAAGRFASRVWDPGLTERGHAHALELIRRFEKTSVDACYSSPLLRARQTISPLAERLGLRVTLVAELAELNLGAWDGKPLAELAASDTAYANWHKDPDLYPPPGGERLCDVGERVWYALQQISTSHPHGGHIVVTTHADCVKGAVARLLGCPAPASRQFTVPNLGQVHLRRSPSGKWHWVLDH